MPLSTLLRAWRTNASFRSNVAAWRTFPARPPQFVPFPGDLYPALATALRSAGVHSLYAHQAASWQHVRTDQNLVVVTGTASGKTLCYNLPVLDSLLRNPDGRALYLFPTKALAQDQRDGLQALLTAAEPTLPLRVATYDGDTPAAARPAIRKSAHIVISNPDMLHSGLLPHHTLWANFFRNLRFVVIDEMHSYRGVFGSHVANVLRRLKRVAHFYGTDPQFVLTSATIANPVELAARLIEADVALVDDDGAARGERHFCIYNPPMVNRELGIRRSTLLESVRITEALLRHDVQTILFARARRTVELILGTLRRRDNTALNEAVRGYRSGYLPCERREIEQGLRDGRIRAVVATNALELGVDIGGMGAAVLAGYPGTIAATRQQAGRAGRTQDEAMAVLITSAGPLDQFLARHPEYFFDRSPEQALINPDNLLILLGHLRCAAFELPFNEGESFGNVPWPDVAEILTFLAEAGVVHRSGDKFFWMADHYPAQDVSLRSASAEAVLLQTPADEGWVTIGQVDQASAPWMVHAGAVYLHDGQAYLVDRLDLAQHIAQMHPADLDYYTEPRTETTVRLLNKADERSAPGAIKAHGEVAVTTEVAGFRKLRWFTQERLGEGEVSLPPTELVTTGYWLALEDQTVEQLRQQGLWNNDPNAYGPNWPVQREQALVRDRRRCQMCGAGADGGALHVHHKTPFRAFAGYREANVLSNLVTLCPRCHRRAELTVRIRSGLAGLAFALGNLAPLFLMCDVRDLGVHFDPQAALAEGRPAVVLYDQVPAGIGFSERLFALHDELLTHAQDVVQSCACAAGCPSCTGPGGEEGSGGKAETLALLKALTVR